MHRGHPRAPMERGRSTTARQDAGATPGGTGESAADKEERVGSEAGEAARTQGDTGGNREPERGGGGSVRMGGSDNTGDGLASQPRCYRVPGQPLLNRHQVRRAARCPAGLSAWRGWEPARGIPGGRGWGVGQASQTHTGNSNPPPRCPRPPCPPPLPRPCANPPPPFGPLLYAHALQAETSSSTSATHTGPSQVSGRGMHRDSQGSSLVSNVPRNSCT